jgi:hypothetical protein
MTHKPVPNMKNRPITLAVLSSAVAVLLSVPAQAGLHSYPGDTGTVPQSDGTLGFEHAISGEAFSITSLEIILTFNDASSLSGNSSGIEGHLLLGTGVSAPYVDFFPVATSSSGQQRTYDATFTDFNGLNPNNTWGLVLWDNSTSGIENHLNGWSLNITAVPEPVNIALGIFAGLSASALVVRSRRVRGRVQRWHKAANKWIDAV